MKCKGAIFYLILFDFTRFKFTTFDIVFHCFIKDFCKRLHNLFFVFIIGKFNIFQYSTLTSM